MGTIYLATIECMMILNVVYNSLKIKKIKYFKKYFKNAQFPYQYICDPAQYEKKHRAVKRYIFLIAVNYILSIVLSKKPN